MLEPRITMLSAAIVFAGAGAGGVARFALHAAVQRWWGASFPMGTLAGNLLGCLAIGVLMAIWPASASVREEWRIAATVGVLGGFTTFSAFGRETVELMQQGHSGRAVAYVVASVVIGVAAVWIGVLVGGALRGGGPPVQAH